MFLVEDTKKGSSQALDYRKVFRVLVQKRDKKPYPTGYKILSCIMRVSGQEFERSETRPQVVTCS